MAGWITAGLWSRAGKEARETRVAPKKLSRGPREVSSISTSVPHIVLAWQVSLAWPSLANLDSIRNQMYKKEKKDNKTKVAACPTDGEVSLLRSQYAGYSMRVDGSLPDPQPVWVPRARVHRH